MPVCQRQFLARKKAIATRWYDQDAYAPKTYCNPMNISYNYEPFNNNVRTLGSFRSSADPMGLTYKGEHFLFSTNQGGFHYSKDLTQWEFAPASFQRRPTDDDQCAPSATPLIIKRFNEKRKPTRTTTINRRKTTPTTTPLRPTMPPPTPKAANSAKLWIVAFCHGGTHIFSLMMMANYTYTTAQATSIP